MIDIQILRDNDFFKDLPDDMLEKIADISWIEKFENESYIFHQGEGLMNLHLLLSGKVSLKLSVADDKMVTLAKIEPLGTFGIHALMEENTSSFTAITRSDCEIVKVPARKILYLLKDDFKMGHLLMIQALKLLKQRMEDHTTQFLQVLYQHPDVANLIDIR